MRLLEVSPNPENATTDAVVVAMEAAPNKRRYIRPGALRALLPGLPRDTVCRLYCRTDRRIRLWIEMLNRGSLDALLSKPRTGWPRRVSLTKPGDLLLPVLKDSARATAGSSPAPNPPPLSRPAPPPKRHRRGLPG